MALTAALVGLLLPAVQAARETARLTQCRNNVRQVALALLAFHDHSGRFPQGGWGHEWIGTTERGAGKRQPGGWAFQLLPLLEQAALYSQFRSDAADATRLLATPIPPFTCPARRPCQAWPASPRYAYLQSLKPGGSAILAARGDYAINGGATLTLAFAGPASLAAGDAPTYPWPIVVGPTPTDDWAFTGVSHVRASSSLEQIVDGASATYLLGEKFLDVDHYADGEFLGDNETLYSGYCSDNHRFTKRKASPLRDASAAADHSLQYRFGSPHAAGALFGYCDGSVQLVSFDVAEEVHYRSGHTHDAGAELAPLP